MSGVKDPGVNTVHRTEGCPARPVHGAFQHSMARRCFNHDYRAPFFYMVTMTTRQRRPWFGVCENSACTLSADGVLVRDLWHRIPRDYPQIELSTLCLMPDHLHGLVRVTGRMEKTVGVPPLFKPNGRYFDLFVQGRLLILSRSEAAVHGSTPLTRETCLALNSACAHLAEAPTTEVSP